MAQVRADEIARVLRQQIENYDAAVNVAEVGSVISVGDGIARVHGLEDDEDAVLVLCVENLLECLEFVTQLVEHLQRAALASLCKQRKFTRIDGG